MNCIVSLSSNFDAQENMRRAKFILKTCFSDVVFSSEIETQPWGSGYENSFFNAVAGFSVDLSCEATNQKMKEIEGILGRTAAMKQQKRVPIDLDIICWDDEVVHPDYLRFPFLRTLIAELKSKD